LNIFRESDTFNTAEIAAIERLVGSHAVLPDDTKSEEIDLEACSIFLDDLASAAQIIGLRPAPRRYRESFTPNYRAIFPDDTRNYRVDVLEGCLDQPTGIYVNGDCFELSAETVCCSDALHAAWAALGAFLKRWDPGAGSTADGMPSTSPKRQELCKAFQTFDFAWAGLERKYINELIAIEARARDLIIKAISCEKKLYEVEVARTTLRNDVHEKAQHDLVQSVCRLNSVANHRRKGRDDLGADILVAATMVASKFGSSSALIGGADTVANDAGRHLAADVLQSFEAVRQYLREVEHRLESVDPHLCNNVGLVARLVDWEESWEVGQLYLTNEPLLYTLCDFVACIQRLQVVEPKLTTMCEDCDVELFLALPRLLVLRYLTAPEKQTHLLHNLLPHRFLAASGNSPVRPGTELTELARHFQQATRAVSGDFSQADPNDPKHVTSMDDAAWKVFAHAAVSDMSDREDGPAATAVGDFMRAIEWWSVEVQRHCPEDWNQCSAVLVQCLTKNVRSSTNFQIGFLEI